MIFKTFDSDIDNISSKWGVFGKSFNNISSDIENRWSNVLKTLQETNNYTLSDIANAWKNANINSKTFLADDDVVNILDRYNRAIDSGAEATAKFLNSGTENEFMDGFLKDLDGAPATMEKYNEAIKSATSAQKALSVSTIATKAAVLALNVAVSMGLTFVLGGLVSVIDDLVHSEENLRKSANDLGSELSSSTVSIENYKTKIEELKSVINDSSSSFDEVSQARVDLMKVQDELIDKFGSEKGAIENITEAINGQTDALDELSRKSYYGTKNKFNEKSAGEKFSDWLSFGNTDDERVQSKMDQMVSSMRYSAYELETTGNEVLDKLISKSYGLNIFNNMYGDGQHFQITGTLDEIQNKLYSIQELSSNFEVSSGFENSFTKISNDVDDALKNYKNLYDQYILWEKVLNENPDNQYDEQFKLINDAKESYNEAVKSNNEESIKKAADEYAKTVSSAMELANQNYDYDVVDYFESMYPELQQIVGEWRFNLNFEPNTDGLQDKVESALDSIDGTSDSKTNFSIEDIQNFNPNVATQEQIDAYGTLKNIANEYGFSIEQLTFLLQQMGLVQSESYKQLVEQFGQNNVDKLTSEDLIFAYKIENIGSISFDELQTKIKKLRYDNETPDLWDYSETISQLDTIKEKFDVLDNAFAKLHDADKSTQIGFDDFSSINEAFKDLDGIDTYIQRLQEAGQNQEQVTSVMQDLISAYLDYSNVLDNITDENKDLVVSMLEELGVANALDVVNAKLSGSLFSVADAENLVVQYGYSLIQITTDEINGLVLEGAISEQTAQQLAILALQKQLTNDAKIETEEEVNRIYNLAKMAGIGAEALAKFAQFKNDLENTTDARTRSWIIKSINTYKSTLFKEIDGVKTNEDIFTPVKYTGGKATKSAASSAKKEAKKTMEDIQKDWKEYLDKYLALYKAELDAGLIDFQTFLNKSRSLLDEFYRDGKISAKDYWDSVGNLYQQQLDVYDKVISAITKRIDKEIEGIQGIIDGLEKQNDVLQNQLDEYDGILKVVDDVYQTEIDSIKQKQDAIDDTISKLQDENDEKQRAIDLEKARYQLYRALNNRNVKLYNGKEYIYTHDREEVRDAQQNLADLELQETVAGLEKEKNALDEVIAELEKYRDLWAEISSAKQNEEYKQLAIAIWGKDYEKLILSNRISDIESFKDNYIHIQQQIEDNQGLIDSYNEKIEYYDALKQAWNAIATEREETVNREMAAQVLGATWENDILNGRMEVLNNFRNQYLATQQAIVDAAWNAANAQIAALNAIKSAESTSSQTSSSSKAPTVSGNKNTPTKKPSKPSKPNANSGGGISNLPTIEKYGSGTDNAKPGWHEVAESGNEIIRDNNGNAYIAKGRQIHLFEGGETVYSASDTRELLSGSISPLDAGIGEVVVFDHDKMRKNLQQLIPDYMNTMPSMINIPRYNVDNVRSGNPININIGDINLHEVQSVDGLAKAIIRELPGKVNQAMYRK